MWFSSSRDRLKVDWDDGATEVEVDEADLMNMLASKMRRKGNDGIPGWCSRSRQ